MSHVLLQMDLFSGLIMSDIEIWNKQKSDYNLLSIAIDTGASVSTISRNILYRAGYDVFNGKKNSIITASGVESVTEVTVDRIKLDSFEVVNVLVYAYDFPQESFASGVLGLNVLSMFDVNLLFSKKLIELTKI